MDLQIILGWGSPIGIGIFLLCLAGTVYVLSKAGKDKNERD